jgi:hypothetical protein
MDSLMRELHVIVWEIIQLPFKRIKIRSITDGQCTGVHISLRVLASHGSTGAFPDAFIDAVSMLIHSFARATF